MRDPELFSFEPTSKRRKGYPSESRVKRGVRVVRGDKELFLRSSDETTRAPAGAEGVSSAAACAADAFDGVTRDEYFRE